MIDRKPQMPRPIVLLWRGFWIVAGAVGAATLAGVEFQSAPIACVGAALGAVAGYLVARVVPWAAVLLGLAPW